MFKLRTLTVSLRLGLGLATLLCLPLLAQPIAVDTRVAGPQPVVEANNGVPVVNIAPPGAGGVSNNAFTHFNVGPAGVVLNNSASASQTQLAGQVSGNPMLGNGPAATILNQVTAPNPSQLLGTLEVAGQRANVIVANPAGITCNGCGFLNANRATLTTGRPQVGPDGRIGFDVASGTILIDGAGLNAGADHRASLGQVDLLARAIKINAGIWAERLKLVTGATQVDYDSEQVTAKTSDGNKPAFALDTAALGSMYANSIRLIGTEAGVGVNLGGHLAALTGEIHLTSAGEVRIAPSATLKAEGDLEITTAAGIHNNGSLLAGVGAGTDVPIAGQGSVKLLAGTVGLSHTGTIAAGKDATLTAGWLALKGGSLSAPGRLALNTIGNNHSGIQIHGTRVAGGTVDLQAGNLNNYSDLTARDNLTVTVKGALVNEGGKLTAGGDLTVQALFLNNGINQPGGILSAGGTLTLNVEESLANRGMIKGDGTRIKAAAVTNASDGRLHAGAGSVQVLATRYATSYGEIKAERDVHIEAGDVFMGGLVQASNDLSVTAANKITSYGRLVADADQGSIQLQAPAIETSGAATAGKAITLMADQLKLAGGTSLSTPGKLVLHTADDIDIGQRALQGTTWEIHARNLSNKDNHLTVKGDFTARLSGWFNNTGGTLAAGERLTIVQSSPGAATGQRTGQGTGLSSLNNYHGQIAAPHVLIKLAQVDNPGGQILGDQVSIEAQTLTNRAGSPGGVIAARQALNLGVKELDNGAHALLYSQGDLSIGGALDENNQAVGVAQTISNAGGIIDAHGKVVAQARTITNGQGATVLAGHTVLWPKEALSNDANSQVITGDFLLDTDRFTNTGRLEARIINMTANHFDNVGKLVRADQHLQLQGKGPESTLDNRQGLLMSAGSMQLKFDRLNNAEGTVLAAGDADVHIGQMLGSGRWVMGGKLDLHSPGPWTQGTDALIDAGHLHLRVGSLYNQGGVYGDTVSLEAPKIHNQGGVIAARSRLDIGAGTLENQAQGWIASADSFTLGGALDGAGRAVGQADRVQNRGATLESLGDFTLTAVQLNNENARLETAQVTVAGPASHFSIQPKGESERMDSSRLIEITVGNKDRYAIYPPATAPPFSYAQLRSWVAQAVGLEGRVSRKQENFYQALQTIEASIAVKRPVPRYLLKSLAEPLGQLSRYPELQEASLPSREAPRQAGLFVAGEIDAWGQDPVFLHDGNTSIGRALFSWFKSTGEVSQKESDAVRYAPLLEEARHYAAWKRAVQGGLFKAETGGPIELLKAWRVLENRPVIDEYSGSSFWIWNNAQAAKPPVLPLLPHLTQLGYLTSDQASQAQPYYAAQILAEPRWAKEWREFETQRTVSQTQVTHSEPGEVLVGGNLNLNIGQQGLNSNSHILAGGQLTYTGQDLTVESAKSERLLHETGRTRQAYIKSGGGWFGPGERLKRTKWQPHEAAPIVLSSSPIAQVAEKTGVPHSPRTIATRRLEAPLPAQAYAPAVDPAYRVTSWTQADGAQVRQLDGIKVPYSGLYRAALAGGTSLYQTEPAFLNGQTQPGLGTLLQALDRQSSVQPLGDGFMESRLVRDQAIALTGQRFLPGFDNDQRTYRALLSQTAVLAHPGQWPVGEPLSASVIQTLPYSVVWPVRQAVIGPDGKTVQALMPTLYLRESAPSLVQAASHVSAPDILVQLAGKLDQDGRVQAQRSLNLQAQEITLRGELMGQTVSTHSGGDTQILGGQLTGEKTLSVAAGGDITIASTVQQTADRTQLERTATLTTTEAGAPMIVQSQGDTTLNAADLYSAGDIAIQSQGNVKLTTQRQRWQETITFGRKNALHQAREDDLGSALNAQGSIVVEAGGDIAGRAVNLVAQDDLSLRAQGDITFEAGQIHTTLDDQWYSRDSGFLYSSVDSFTLHQAETLSQPNMFAGKTVSFVADRIDATDLQIEAQDWIDLNGKQGIVLDSGTQSVFYELETASEKNGWGHSGLVYGQAEHGEWHQLKGRSSSGNKLRSQGDIALQSEGPIKLVYTDLSAQHDLTVQGSSIHTTAGTQSLDTAYRAWQHRSGLSVGVQGIGAAGAAQQGVHAFKAAEHSADDKTQALYRVAAARAFYDAMHVQQGGSIAPGVRVAIGWGTQSSRDTAEASETQSLAGSIDAGRALAMHATDRDIHIEHAHLTAQQIALNAPAGAVQINAGQSTQVSEHHHSSRQSGVEIGASASVQSVGLDIGAHHRKSQGQGQQQEIAWQASSVKAQAVEVTAQDFTVWGSTIKADRLQLEIKRNLRIISLLDEWRQTQKEDQKQTSAQLGLYGPSASSLSFSQLDQDGKAEFKGVNAQAGLEAGAGGLDVKVGGHTELVGAVIEADPAAQNRLLTATLSTADLDGYYKLDAQSKQAGLTLGTPGSLPGVAPLPAHAGLLLTPDQAKKDRQAWRTASGIDPTIAVEIEDEAAQQAQTGKTVQEMLAGLNRDTTQTRPTVDKEVLEKTLDNQKTRLDAWDQGAQAVARTVGDLAQAQYEGAQDEKTRALWAPGGGARILTHALAGSLLGELGGANVAAAAAGAAVSQLLAQPLEAAGQGVTDNPLVAQLLTNLASSAAGAAAGGQAGAATAANLDLYNRQLHPEAKLLEQLTENLGPKAAYRLTAAACALVQCAAGVPKEDPLYEGLTTLQAEGEFLKKEQAFLKDQAPELFAYTRWDKWNDRRTYFDQWVTRAKGMADLGAGSFAAAGSAVLAAGVCGGTLGVACPVVGSLGATGVGFGYYQAKEGTQQLFGAYQSKVGEQVLASFNPATPKSRAPLVQDAIDLGAVVLEAGAVKGILQIVKGVQGAKYADKTEGAAKEGAKGLPTVIEPQTAQQMTQRGWSEQTINGVIAHPTKTVVTKDARWDPVSGTPIHDPATAYIARDGAYVVRNDRTGVIVEVSDRSGNNGMTIWRNGKDGVATWETVGAKTGAKVEEKFAGKAAKTEGVGKESARGAINLEQAASNYFGQERKFWKKDPIQFNGNEVYQRNDLIDPSRIDRQTGLTNKQLMENGLAPYGTDGNKINLHHMLQTQNGPIVEVTQSFHKNNARVIHINYGSDLPSGINRPQFEKWKKEYWKDRASDF